MIYKVLVVASVFVAALAQMLLKKGASQNHKSFIHQYFNIWVMSGYSIMAITMLVNIYAMSRGVLVKEVGAFESLSYLFVPILSWMLFKEKISLRKWGAIATIIIGVFVFFM